MTKSNRKGREQLSVGKRKHTNIDNRYLPTRRRVIVGCRVPSSAKQEHGIIRRLMATIYNRDGSSAAGRCVAAAPVDKCRTLGHGAVHARPFQPTPCQAGSSSSQIRDVTLTGAFTSAHAPQRTRQALGRGYLCASRSVYILFSLFLSLALPTGRSGGPARRQTRDTKY